MDMNDINPHDFIYLWLYAEENKMSCFSKWFWFRLHLKVFINAFAFAFEFAFEWNKTFAFAFKCRMICLHLHLHLHLNDFKHLHLHLNALTCICAHPCTKGMTTEVWMFSIIRRSRICLPFLSMQCIVSSGLVYLNPSPVRLVKMVHSVQLTYIVSYFQATVSFFQIFSFTTSDYFFFSLHFLENKDL